MQMATCSSFIPKYPQSRNVSSVGIEQTSQTKFISHPNSSSKFQPVNMLAAYTGQISLEEKPFVHSLQLEKSDDSNNAGQIFSLANIFKFLDDFVCNFLDLPLCPSIDPNSVLSGNFVPVNELPPTACEVVEGSLPSCLDGAYIRNGPNPHFAPRGPYHLFDGDGMLHMIKISQGKATFCSRYVKTYKYLKECEMGHRIFPSPFSSFNGIGASLARLGLSVARILTGQFSPQVNGFVLANTSVAFMGGHLFALGESDLPYEIKVTPDGDLLTIGRHDFLTDCPFTSMTAHPKIDPDTGEVFAFRYDVVSPFLTYFRIDSTGKKQPDVPIFNMKNPSVMHDMALTRNYAIFSDTQIVINPMEILRGKSPARIDSCKMPRVGLIPRYAKDDREMLWIDAPGFNMMHCFNAWEEEDGDSIVMLVSNMSSVDQALERLDLTELVLEKVTIRMKERTMQRHLLSEKFLDMGGINPAYAGKKSRYAYLSVVAQPMKVVGVVKVDLSFASEDFSNCIVASRTYGPDCSGSEVFFVGRKSDSLDVVDEDDGYLVTYVHDGQNGDKSKFLVMDAKSPTLESIAEVNLPGRIPTGFHGMFVRESELNKT